MLVGIGDDAAVVMARRNHADVLTTDVHVDGVHFTRALSAPGDVGHRALHVNLSDLAAMGAEPRLALLSLGLPADLPASWVLELIGGLVESARAARVTLVGGNISESRVLFVDVTASGSVKPRHVLRRGGARAGDELYLSGHVGAAAAGLHWLQWQAHAVSDAVGALHVRQGYGRPVGEHALPHDPLPASITEAIARYRRPEARVALGVQTARTRSASAAMDTSDGLADALRQLAAASGVGVKIDAAAVPVSPAVPVVAARTGIDPHSLVWSGGEDYELLLAVPRHARRRFLHMCGRKGLPPVTCIGVCTKETTLQIVEPSGAVTMLTGGFEHFDSAAGAGAS